MRIRVDLAVVLSLLIVSGCSSVRGSLMEQPQEVRGYLTTTGFIPCSASAPTERWTVNFHGRATHQAEHLATSRLLDLPQPLFVRLYGYVSRRYEAGELSGGYTRRFSVIDMVSMQVSGACESPLEGSRRYSAASPAPSELE